MGMARYISQLLNSSGKVPQSKLADNVAGNGPAFSAYQSSNQALSNNAYTKVQFQTKEFDTHNCFDNTTNYRFTPNVAGYYQITANFGFNVVQSTECVVGIYKNGSPFKYFGDFRMTALAYMGGTALVYANGSTDYFEIYVYQSSGGSTNSGIGQPTTYFQASMVRAA